MMAISETWQARFVVEQSKGSVVVVDNSDELCDTIIIQYTPQLYITTPAGDIT